MVIRANAMCARLDTLACLKQSESLAHCATHLLHSALELVLAEQRCAGHKCVRAGARAFGGRRVVNSAINLDAVAEPALLPPGSSLLHLGQSLRDEALPAETGIDGHDQQNVDLRQIRLRGGNGCRRIDRKTDLEAKGLDFP